MLNIQALLLASIVSVAVGGFTGWKLNTWKYNSDRVTEIEAQREALTAVATELAKIEVKNVTIKQKVVEHVTEVPVYRDCKHTTDGMQLINQALTGDKSPSDSKLPKANTPDK